MPERPSLLSCRSKTWASRVAGWVRRVAGWVRRVAGWVHRVAGWVHRVAGWVRRGCRLGAQGCRLGAQGCRLDAQGCRLALEDLLLDRAGAQHAVDVHALLLAIPPHARRRLLVVGGVPVRIEEDEPVGADQVEAAAARLGPEQGYM
eukprot:scaffold93524_cov62-Phaeocystis_antarctica.AAC.1